MLDLTESSMSKYEKDQSCDKNTAFLQLSPFHPPASLSTPMISNLLLNITMTKLP